MTIRYPAPLRPGDRIGITSPSSGVASQLTARLDFCVSFLREKGFDVVVGACMDGARYISAPAGRRAAELTEMLLDPMVRAIVPPWGGELAIDLLPLLDWDRIGRAEATWLVGFSDLSTIMTPLTLRTGIATIHGNNLMDTPYSVPLPLRPWLDLAVAPAGASITQASCGRYRSSSHDDFERDPTVSTYALDAPGTWTRLDGGGEIDVTGRLIGGCIETLSNLAGTAYADLSSFAAEHAPEGLLVYVEAAEAESYDIGRRLHGMRLAGWFDEARAVIVGRTRAPGHADFTQHDAVLDALGGLGVPIIADVECGHVPPFLPIVNGAIGTLRWSAGSGSLTQSLT